MKRFKFIFTLLLFTFGMLAIGNVSATEHFSLKEYTIETITLEFRRLDPFVSYKDGYQVLDLAGAHAVGIPATIIALAQEIIEYQNYMREVANKESITELDTSLAEYPLLAEFDAMLQNYKPDEQIEPLASGTHPRGTYSHPVPSNFLRLRSGNKALAGN